MPDQTTITFAVPAMPDGGALVLFVGDDLALAEGARALLGDEAAATVARAAKAEAFKGKARSALVLVAPAGLALDRLVVIGTGGAKERGAANWAQLGGVAMGKLGPAKRATILLEGPPDWTIDGAAAADFALGVKLRAYGFDKYKTKKKDDAEPPPGGIAVTIALQDEAAARAAFETRSPVAEGVNLARDLVNEPPNVLFPVELARRAAEVERLGVEVEVMDAAALREAGLTGLLGVGQGSVHESRVVVMRWKGRTSDTGPIAIVGKGVCFDSGGISIKPAAGMEDMKGDMAGAACVIGLMHALASRKAEVDVVGLVGLVENMPDGAAQRPGDIVTMLSGQTVEIVNTDAEGRLVLADVLTYAQNRFKPRLMIDLATLTGAIIIALGQERAGLFTNDDELAGALALAGEATGERVWRMPLGPEYDKMIDSKFADMKNTGGRHGGSITGAQFIKRFVGDTPWAHLDIAGVGMNAPQSDINRSWASGWGVRLLDRLMRDNYEG